MESTHRESDYAVHVTPDNLFQINCEPLRFFVGLSSQKNHVELLIKKRGGLVLGKLPESFKLQGMVLDLDENGLPCDPEQMTAKLTECFSLSYIESCIEQNKLLNLNDFRIGNKSIHSNSREIKQTKKRFHISEEQLEAVSPSEESHATAKIATSTTPDSVKRYRQKYTHEHDLILVNFVKEMTMKYPEERPLGQKLWQRAEELQILGPYRSWQSMRERFKTRLQPYLQRGSASVSAWNQLPVDAEDPTSSAFDVGSTSSFSESYKDLKKTITASVFQRKSVEESERQMQATEISFAEQQEKSDIMLGINIVSGQPTYLTEASHFPNLLSTNNYKDDTHFCRKLLYDEENKALNCEQERLVQKVVRELSNKYLVPERRVCVALLDANGSVDLAVKFLNSRTFFKDM
ncbi:hypothetical protein Gasu2_26930 [Galdieria sulphuraria]|nr:hypothetical protein Gasu2_26930 [Galdieria sulphuraria]